MSAAAIAQVVEALNVETDPQVWALTFKTAGVDFLQFSASAYRCIILIAGPIGKLTVLGIKTISPHLQAKAQSAWDWQKRQPNEVLAMELGFTLLLLLLYALKRFITRKRYMPRLKRWFQQQKRKIQSKYDQAIERVRTVNSTLAVVLPHLFFLLLSSSLLYFVPSLVGWVAEDLQGVAVMSVIYPTLGSVQSDATALASEILSVEVGDDMSAALRYWVVFGVVSAVYGFLSLLPLATRLCPSVDPTTTSSAKMLFFLYLHSPLDGTALLYKHVCPLALRLADSAAGSKGGRAGGDALDAFISKLTSLLALARMVGLCGEGTRSKADAVLRESLSVVPALVCLGMPSYFVEFGILWSSLLVPAANSARANTNVDLEVTGAMQSQSRWIKYWIAFSVSSCVLGLTAPWWSWAPFSTHFTLLFYVALSIPGMGLVDRIFGVILNELVGWGMISGDGLRGYEVGRDTVIVRGLRAISTHSKKKPPPIKTEDDREEKDAVKTKSE
ncbi:hypothetical protein TrRE_jg10196 [Triparma retinervis]|uniref:Uncharacterized protein n=1 Tax=Triparma retinervis TaxID=2557542 RepID=A0A9W7DR94_9STRA|nr:hypothetical protein TrRE_jg10196 [Triparma retinervis]